MKKKGNSFDALFEKLLQSPISTDMEKVAGNPKAMILYTAVVRKLAEIQELKNLFKRDFLPSVEKSIFATNVELHKSKYKKILLAYLPDDGIREIYNETVRLGYVALFHKFESFVTLLIKELNGYFEEIFERKESVKKFAEREFKMDPWPPFSIELERIRWICNSIKHTDAFPKIQPVPSSFVNYPKDKKVVLSKEDLMMDMDIVYAFCEDLVKYGTLMCIYKAQVEFDREPDQDIREKLDDLKKQIERLGLLMTGKLPLA